MFENITTEDLVQAATVNGEAAKAKLELLHDLKRMGRINTAEYRLTWEQIDSLMISARLLTDEFLRRMNVITMAEMRAGTEAPGA